MPEVNGTNGLLGKMGWKLLPWLADIVCALLCFWAVQINIELKDQRREVQALKEWKAETAGNRYTARDHYVYAAATSKEIQVLWARVAETQQTWLNDINDVKVTLANMPKKDDLRDAMSALEKRVDRLEERVVNSP